MVVNDDVPMLNERGVFAVFAGKLTPTGKYLNHQIFLIPHQRL
jgi:hypothetical protein